jgi:hypothetical protein
MRDNAQVRSCRDRSRVPRQGITAITVRISLGIGGDCAARRGPLAAGVLEHAALRGRGVARSMRRAERRHGMGMSVKAKGTFKVVSVIL